MVRGVVPPRRRAAQAGLSLVETLVALVLGLAMVSVAFNLYVSNRGVFRQIEAMVRLQESASVAAALLENSIRHAGGTLCRRDPSTTILLDVQGPTKFGTHDDGTYPYNFTPPYAFWEEVDSLSDSPIGLHGYQSTSTDTIVGTERLAGDSISLMSDNMGAIARVTGRATYTSQLTQVVGFGWPKVYDGLTGTYTFPVDNGLEFPEGTVAMACDHVRAVLFQVNKSSATGIQLQSGTGAPALRPGNCSVAMRKVPQRGATNDIPIVENLDGDYSCTTRLSGHDEGGRTKVAMYTFGPGSMIGEHTFEHWYIGRKTGTTNGLSLFRKRMVYASAEASAQKEIRLGQAEEIAQDVTDMQISYLRGVVLTGYAERDTYRTAAEMRGGTPDQKPTPYAQVTAVRIVLTLRSPEKVGLAATGAASAVTYTIPINVAIRNRMPGVVRR